MIDVIIPAYNAHNTIDKTLKSIEKQTIKDKLKVYIIDDCSKEPYDYLKDKYDLDITIYRLDENGGPGVARQYGVDHSSSEYITFIDSDDIFFKKRSLEILYKYIRKDYDIVVAKTYDEYYDVYAINENDLHSKIYSRKFLEMNLIRFNETRFHEDNMFDNLVLIMNARYKVINETLYLYSNNKNSISRNSFEKEFKNLEILLYNLNFIDRFIEDKCYDEEMYTALRYSKYIYLNKFYFMANKKEKELLKEWVLKYDPKNIDILGVKSKSEMYEIYTSKKRFV